MMTLESQRKDQFQAKRIIQSQIYQGKIQVIFSKIPLNKKAMINKRFNEDNTIRSLDSNNKDRGSVRYITQRLILYKLIFLEKLSKPHLLKGVF